MQKVMPALDLAKHRFFFFNQKFTCLKGILLDIFLLLPIIFHRLHIHLNPTYEKSPFFIASTDVAGYPSGAFAKQPP